VVDRARLESVCTAMYRGFESLSLRKRREMHKGNPPLADFSILGRLMMSLLKKLASPKWKKSKRSGGFLYASFDACRYPSCGSRSNPKIQFIVGRRQKQGGERLLKTNCISNSFWNPTELPVLELVNVEHSVDGAIQHKKLLFLHFLEPKSSGMHRYFSQEGFWLD
jgi:hypothetical protein